MSDTLKQIRNWVIAIIVLIIILSIFFSPEQGLLNKTKDRAMSFAKMVGIIKTESYVDPTKTPENLDSSFKSLIGAIQKSNNSEKCFVRYNEFSQLSLFKIQLNAINTDEGQKLYLKLLSPETQVLEFQTIDNIKPCVVAGSKTVTNNFINNWIDDKTKKNPDYTEYSNIELKLNFDWGNENNIYFDGHNEEIEDQGILYKPDKEHICFFATTDGFGGCNGDSYWLDDVCLEDLSEKIDNDPKLLCGD